MSGLASLAVRRTRRFISPVVRHVRVHGDGRRVVDIHVVVLLVVRINDHRGQTAVAELIDRYTEERLRRGGAIRLDDRDAAVFVGDEQPPVRRKVHASGIDVGVAVQRLLKSGRQCRQQFARSSASTSSRRVREPSTCATADWHPVVVARVGGSRAESSTVFFGAEGVAEVRTSSEIDVRSNVKMGNLRK